MAGSRTEDCEHEKCSSRDACVVSANPGVYGRGGCRYSHWYTGDFIQAGLTIYTVLVRDYPENNVNNMTTLQRMKFDDLLNFNIINFDELTETFGMDFYASYLNTWPHYQMVAKDSNGFYQGYVIAKAEGEDHLWHAHVSAVTVSPDTRRMGLGGQLMEFLEQYAVDVDKAYFVDLFVRKSNEVAINMYKNRDYIIFRTIKDYYRGPPSEENGVDMRKALPRDKELKKSSLICDKTLITPDELEFY